MEFLDNMAVMIHLRCRSGFRLYKNACRIKFLCQRFEK